MSGINENNLGRCKSCSAIIIWAKNVESGKMVPLNKRLVAAYELLQDGATTSVVNKGPLYISHFITCPGAANFSKRNKS